MQAKSSAGGKSIKHAIIDKANARMFAAIAIAVFVVVFCIFAAKALIDQSIYNNRVISAKSDTLKVLESNKKEADKLHQSYLAFATEPINVLGGSPTGDGPQDGDNATLVLDALPSELDVPAQTTSLEKVLINGGYGVKALGGDDAAYDTDVNKDEAAFAQGQTEPIEYEVPFAATASLESSINLFETLQSSIRPYKITSLSINGGASQLELSIGMVTYYKPAVGLQVSSEVIQ